MSTASVYIFDMPGKSAVTLSSEELRSLLGQIETNLHRSQVYRRIVDTLQILLGDAGEQAKVLCKALGREAISLAFHQFAQEYPAQDTTDTSANIEIDNSQNLSNCQTKAISTTQQHSINTDASVPTVEESTKDVSPNTASQLSQSFNSNRKPAKAQSAKQLAQQQRLEAMLHIGLQLKQARESQNKSLEQLHIYTHISIDQMEAVENGSLELLPEDGFVRDYIRIMANVLGINGTILAASLPKPGAVRPILPTWCRPQKKPSDLRLEIRPLHLYLGYTALVAGAVGGLSCVYQPATTSNLLNSDVVNSPVPSDSQSPPYRPGVTNKPGIKTSPVGIRVGHDIAPPEIL